MPSMQFAPRSCEMGATGMREYGVIFASYWTSADTQSLPDDAKLLGAYLLTCSHGTIAGCFRLPDGYVCEDLRWPETRVAEGFTQLLAKGWANRCGTTKWVWIRRFLEWNKPQNPNQRKSLRSAACQIPENCSWLADFIELYPQLSGDTAPLPLNPCATVVQPLDNGSPLISSNSHHTKTTPEQDHTRDLSTSSTGASQNGTKGNVSRENDAAAIERVFEHWKSTHQHPRAVLDAKRRKLISNALKNYSEADLCQAITGYRNSPHHMGTDPRGNGTAYNAIELLLRDAQHVDAGLKFYAEPPRTDLSETTRRSVEATADWIPPEVRHAGR